MATITFNPLVAVDFTAINTALSTVDGQTPTSNDFDTAAATDIDMEGAGLTYDGSNNVTGGTITRIDIDLNSDQTTLNGGDINISGLSITSTADLGSLDNGSTSLFGVALQGDDTFLLAGLNEDVDTPTLTNRLFGDDLANLILFTAGSINNNNGGADVFTLADNRLEISGDVWTANSSFIGSTYNGGDDTVFGVTTEEFNRISGDAWILDRTGAGQMTLNGGNDNIDLNGNTSGSSWISGDVNEMYNGVLNGGDDEMSSDNSATPEIAGDVRTYSGGQVNGGDDIISLTNSGRAGGDVYILDAPAPDGVFTITGGHDEIYGGSGNDLIGGDVYDRNSAVDNLIVGGDDLIVGGAGDDQLYGEVALGDGLTGVSGGNDTIYGGAGSDTIHGQTGNDVLDGGSGNDDMFGEAGIDTMDGGSGNDTMNGGVSADTLRGGLGDDNLQGGNGADLLVGGDGVDSLYGQGGADIFDYNSINDSKRIASAADTIFDFSRADGDKIDLSTIDANLGLVGDQAFSFIGASNFSGVSGQLRYATTALSTFITGDIDGDTVNDFMIKLDGSTAMLASDFFL